MAFVLWALGSQALGVMGPWGYGALGSRGLEFSRGLGVMESLGHLALGPKVQLALAPWGLGLGVAGTWVHSAL